MSRSIRQSLLHISSLDFSRSVRLALCFLLVAACLAGQTIIAIETGTGVQTAPAGATITVTVLNIPQSATIPVNGSTSWVDFYLEGVLITSVRPFDVVYRSVNQRLFSVIIPPGLGSGGLPQVYHLKVRATSAESVTYENPVDQTGAFSTANLLTVYSQAITSVTPSNLPQATTGTLQISGAGTGWTNTSTVTVGGGGVTMNVISAASDSLTVQVNVDPGAALGPRSLSVTTGGQTVTLDNAITVIPQLTISPVTVVPGTNPALTVTAQNLNFGSAAGVSLTGSGVTPGTVTIANPTQLQIPLAVSLTAAPGGRTVSVTHSNTLTSIASPQLQVATPSLAIAPSSGVQGSTVSVTLTGTNTAFATGQTSVTVSGTGVTVSNPVVNGAGQITAQFVIAPGAATGLRTVTVQTGAQVLTTSFTVNPAGPRLISINPPSGAQGATLDVVITGEGTNFTSGPLTVSLGPGITFSSVTPATATTINARIVIDSGASLGLRDLVVTSGGTPLTLADAFSVVPPSGDPFTCRTSAGVPPILRAEGYTELTGDLLLICTGGTAGAVRTVNLQLFLNTQITSRITDNGTEALLIVDDLSTNPLPGGATPTPGSYRAQRASGSESSLIWVGVNLVEPGVGQRLLRIVNVRANAAALGVSATALPSSVIAFLSASPTQSAPIVNPQQVVGYVQPGVGFDLRGCNGVDAEGAGVTLLTCLNHNASGSTDLIGGATGDMQFAVRFVEGFPTAFKPQLAVGQLPGTPGASYHSESGFLSSGFSFATGGANTGTRLLARFTNIPAGARIFVTTSASFGSSSGLQAVLVQTGVQPGPSGTPMPGAVVGQPGNYTLLCAASGNTGQAAAELTVVNGQASAVWEVVTSSPAQLDSAVFGVAVALPRSAPGQATVASASVSGGFAPAFAPASGASTASSVLPIPRFTEPAITVPAFGTAPCITTLLFPFVASVNGFDTGIAISNTSRDPLPTPEDRAQSGRCTLHFYGGSGGQSPPSQTTTGSVGPGETLTMVLSSGGGLGLTGVPDFRGYIIAQCDFQFGHGFAFLTDGPVGSARVAEGYLALVLGASGNLRGPAQAEVRGH